MRKEVAGTIVDPLNGTMFPGAVVVEDGILEIRAGEAPACFIIPGFIDAHVHIESSMLVLSESKGPRCDMERLPLFQTPRIATSW